MIFLFTRVCRNFTILYVLRILLSTVCFLFQYRQQEHGKDERDLSSKDIEEAHR